jgi:hypothetical protein
MKRENNRFPLDEELINYPIKEGIFKPSFRKSFEEKQYFEKSIPKPFFIKSRNRLLAIMLLSFIIPTAISGLLIWWICNTYPYATLLIGIIGTIFLLSIDEFRSTLSDFSKDSGAEKIIALLSIPFLMLIVPYFLPLFIGLKTSISIMKFIANN